MIRTLLATVISIAFHSGHVLAHGDAKHERNAAKSISTEEKKFGREGDPKKVSRTVKIDMSDKMRFVPASLAIKRGETVKFVVKNNGKTMHEMVLGTMRELKQHAEMMKKHPTMEHDEPYMAHVASGKTETMIWQFTKAGDFYYGCLIPGHFEAGMVGEIRVLAKGEKK
jgi:uncharacterized cupredoxin-like copper-binding protein